MDGGSGAGTSPAGTGTSRSKPGAGSAPPRHWRLQRDCEKYYFIILRTKTPSLAGKLKAWLWNFELPCIAVYRFGQLAATLLEKSKLLGAIPFLLYLVPHTLLRLTFHLEIHHKCRIGPAFHLGHPYMIILGPTEIGSNCNVAHNVTVGMGLGVAGRGLPVIGNNVWIGPGAILTGPITIGDGATIAAGAVVSRDVPPRTLVAGNPGRVVRADYDNTELLGYTMPEGER